MPMQQSMQQQQQITPCADWGSAESKILLVGEENAGRWTIMQQIERINCDGQARDRRPGFGVALHFRIKAMTFAMIDGGGPANSSLPSQAPDLIIFVVDGTGGPEVGPVRDFYASILRRYPGAPVSFFINKKDLLTEGLELMRADAIKSGIRQPETTYMHITCATDTANVKFCFNAVVALMLELRQQASQQASQQAP